MAAVLVSIALVGTACGSSEESGVASGEATDQVTQSGSGTSPGDAADTAAEDTGDTGDTGDTDAAVPAVTDSGDGDKPQATLPSGKVTELIIDDIVVGDGEEAVAGMLVEVHYVGVLACNGIEFDASWNRGQTFDFVLGASQVIYGWDAGVEGMRVGGQRQLTIPSHQAYGAGGSGSIAPNSDLVFVVDLLSVEDSDAEITPRAAPEPAPAAPANPDKPIPTLPDGPVAELVTEDRIVGDGATAEAGMVVEVNYVGVLACNGEEFDASWNRDQTFSFVLGAGGVIPGWDIGVDGMREGGQRQLTIPFSLAYGSTGSGSIPAGADLVFVVDLVSVGAGQPPFNYPETVSGELEIEDLVDGTGPGLAENELALVHFAAAVVSTQTQVESTWASGGQPITMSTGPDALAGLAQGLIGAQVGTVRQLIVPPELAFGSEGQPNGGIGPDETLIIIVEVVELRGPVTG